MAAQKKMNLLQLTFIVAVNMMGSGIIMLPTNMAKVGAISLLSWIVTALGSMAIAYGFAQAGLYNQRPGGMAAYAEDAYGKSGYFVTFFLYFLSLAIGNVAIGDFGRRISGDVLSLAVRNADRDLYRCDCAAVADDGGQLWRPRHHRPHWLLDGVGRHPAGRVPLARRLVLVQRQHVLRRLEPAAPQPRRGHGSSIALTLWAFLGMESAAQNSDAVENPKRDVPLACMFGTLGAAVVYVLSTTVIQGIVPNAELAKSTGPFGLAYAQMFSPTVGSIVMALAMLACLGSLLGWQFTLAQTAKSAADERMFPAFFSKVNRMGAPITGMIILGVVQSLLALSTISPTLSEQFSALVNLAVVTNVAAVHHLALCPPPDDAGGTRGRHEVPARTGDHRRGDPLQHLRDLCLGRRCRAGRHDGARRRIPDLGLHRPAVHVAKAACGASHAGGVTVSALPVQGEGL